MTGEIIRGVIAFIILISWIMAPLILAFRDLDKNDKKK